MRKITFKITTFLLLSMFATEAKAQSAMYPNVWTVNGSYKISTYNVTPQLFLTINGSTGALEWAAELAGNDPTQVWTVTDHRQPASAGYVEITANAGGQDWTMIADQSSYTGSGDKDITISVRTGVPIDNVSDPNYGYDQFQKRRTSDFAGPGNNALFVKVPGEAGSRYGVIPTAAGQAVMFDGGGIDALEFFLINSLSSEEFDKSSIFVSNPVNNQLDIKGLPLNVKQITVYSLLGKEVLTREINAQSSFNIDISNLKSGMYLVKMQSDNAVFTKKILKQ